MNVRKKREHFLSKARANFLYSFEEGNPAWNNSEYHVFQTYLSIQWKQLNINKFRQNNPEPLLKLNSIIS
ncbi:hypothetical protein FACS189421_07750 [Bacteroidia bacterium]|nr:hypothetical protein FACS189421_07750 [Bacteroidia bacterium]